MLKRQDDESYPMKATETNYNVQTTATHVFTLINQSNILVTGTGTITKRKWVKDLMKYTIPTYALIKCLYLCMKSGHSFEAYELKICTQVEIDLGSKMDPTRYHHYTLSPLF